MPRHLKSGKWHSKSFTDNGLYPVDVDTSHKVIVPHRFPRGLVEVHRVPLGGSPQNEVTRDNMPQHRLSWALDYHSRRYPRPRASLKLASPKFPWTLPSCYPCRGLVEVRLHRRHRRLSAATGRGLVEVREKWGNFSQRPFSAATRRSIVEVLSYLFVVPSPVTRGKRHR